MRLCFLIVLFVTWAQIEGRSIPRKTRSDDIDALAYLQKYGYISWPADDRTSRQAGKAADIAASLRAFQRWNNLPVTGVLDEETMKLMSTPRCGVEDPPLTKGMPKPYVLEPKWSKNILTYKIKNFTLDLTQADTSQEIKRAFKFWTDAADLRIDETNGTPDIAISFERGDHGDGSPFDDTGLVLARALLPEKGICHFNDGKYWTVNSTNDTNLFIVAAHEFGHILGLRHSNVKTALMYPYYRGYTPNYTMDPDDRAAIVQHYGRSTNSSTPSTIRVPSSEILLLLILMNLILLLI